jgi:carbohydrate-binding DOMON domain-containing protein
VPSKDQHTIVIPPDVWAEVEKRTPPGYGGGSAAIATMLRRYVALLAESRTRNRDTFTPDELMLIRDALAGSASGADVSNALMVYTDGGDMEPLAAATLAKIEALSPTDKIALVDSIERSRIQEAAGKRIIATQSAARAAPTAPL